MVGKIIKLTAILIMLVLPANYSMAEEQASWEKEFVLALQEGKIVEENTTEGLGYTLAQEEKEEQVLRTAIAAALQKEAPPCEAMKIAVDLNYKPYSVLKNIFSEDADVDLDQLCMCATEKGVGPDILAQVATDTNRIDEATQAQCFRDIGLGFTPEEPEDLEPIDLGPLPEPFSFSNPT